MHERQKLQQHQDHKLQNPALPCLAPFGHCPPSVTSPPAWLEFARDCPCIARFARCAAAPPHFKVYLRRFRHGRCLPVPPPPPAPTATHLLPRHEMPVSCHCELAHHVSHNVLFRYLIFLLLRPIKWPSFRLATFSLPARATAAAQAAASAKHLAPTATCC
jgi:hypothetical protein